MLKLKNENEYLALLREWCDALIDLQITEKKNPALYGGILCPSCARVHGRCADAMYPMMTMYRQTGDEKYLNSAKMMFQWVENNMRRPDGSYINDTNSTWQGITVFASVQLGECLIYHGDLLDAKTRETWTNRLDECAAFLADFIDRVDPNINYPVTCATSLAVAAKVLGKEEYRQKSYELAHRVIKSISEDGMIIGEGHPSGTSPFKGGEVDLGYNVEESLSSLVTYVMISGDDSILPEIVRSMKAHLEFMLPDGAWDNSWGSRSAKWTYWGSRTSDGCQICYGYLGKDYPEFAEAAQRNFELYRACTYGGLLYGGPMYQQAGELPCSHHTFCHAKTLAFMIDHDFQKPSPRVSLPRDTAQGIKYYPTPNTWLLADGDWRATATDCNGSRLYAYGGALTMLWNKKVGPVLAASLRDYSLVEPNNMQLPQIVAPLCQTPRIELRKDGRRYLNINDFSAEAGTQEGDSLLFRSTGILRDENQEGEYSYTVSYGLSGNTVEIRAVTNAEGASYRLPVIFPADQQYAIDGGNVSLQRGSYTIKLEANTDVAVTDTGTERVFHPVGGFQTVPFEIPMNPGEELVIRLSVE